MEGKGGGTIERALPIDHPIEYSIGWPEVDNQTTDGDGRAPLAYHDVNAKEWTRVIEGGR